MALARHEVEREAVFFGILRERLAPVEVLRPTEDDARQRLREADARQRLREADELICEWLDEAEAEGEAILERARAEAAQIRLAAAREAAEVLAGVRSLQAQVALPSAAEVLVVEPVSPPRRPLLRRLLRRG